MVSHTYNVFRRRQYTCLFLCVFYVYFMCIFLIQHYRISNQPASLDSRSHRVECSPPDPVLVHDWHIVRVSATDYGTQFGSEVGLWSV